MNDVEKQTNLALYKKAVRGILQLYCYEPLTDKIRRENMEALVDQINILEDLLLR